MRALPVCLAILGIVAGAQSTVHPTTSEGLVRTQIQGISIPPIAGAPFTAKEVVTWVEPLVGGGTVTRTYYANVARDAQGRVRREMRNFVAASSTVAPPLRSFTILDPVAGKRLTCVASSMICSSSTYRPRLAAPGDPATDDSGGPVTAAGGKITRTSLGQQTIGNLAVVGTRESASSVTGDGPGGRLMVSSRDLWYSPDLQVDISVIRTNPQMGQITLTLTNIVRGDPDPTRFAAPAGYQTRGSAVP